MTSICICKQTNKMCKISIPSNRLLCATHNQCDIVANRFNYTLSEMDIVKEQLNRYNANCTASNCKRYNNILQPYFYQLLDGTSKRCPHCSWIKNESKNFNPIVVIEASPIEHFISSSVLISRKFFLYTYSVILQQHSSTDLDSMLYGCVTMSNYVNRMFEMNDICILISNGKKDDYNEKEHLHGFVIMNSDDSKKKFDKQNGVVTTKTVFGIPRTEPFEDDMFANFDEKETLQVLYGSNNDFGLDDGTFYTRVREVSDFDITEQTDMYIFIHIVYTQNIPTMKMTISFGKQFPDLL